MSFNAIVAESNEKIERSGDDSTTAILRRVGGITPLIRQAKEVKNDEQATDYWPYD